MKILLIVAVIATLWASADASEVKKDSWTKTYTVNASPTLVIRNVWGSVKVKPGPSGEIKVSVKEQRSAATQEDFEWSKEVIQLSVDASDDAVKFKVGDPEKRWNSGRHCDDCRLELEFDVVVPPDALIDVRTVLDGDVQVRDIRGVVSAGNVNGAIDVSGVHNCARIKTVNGPVDIAFAKAPTDDCSFDTINGDITLIVPATAGLDVAVDLFNGDVSSDLPIEPMARPASVEQVTKKGRNKFLIRKQSGFRIGSGGPLYTVESMNGDIQIRKQ
ncbi:MAG: hypothetical protein AAF465_05965 [Pseudomonadota bacterium]